MIFRPLLFLVPLITAGAVQAAELAAAFDAADQRAVTLGLRALKMSESDLGFQKTNAESELILKKAALFLQQPLTLPVYGQYLMTNLQTVGSMAAIAALAQRELEVSNLDESPTPPAAVAIDPAFLAKLPLPVARAVQNIADAGNEAKRLLAKALPEDKLTPFSAFALDHFDLDEDQDEMAAWEHLGIDTSKIRDMRRRSENLETADDEESKPFLEASDHFDAKSLMASFERLSGAVDKAIADLKTNLFTESFQAEIDTPLGKIICGGVGANTYTNEAFLIIDTGGDDTYLNSAGGANGLLGRPLSIVIDLAGKDQFVSRNSFSQGCGLFGIGILAALGSDSTFAAKSLSQGAGFFGCGLLITGAGNQTFVADTFCQGASMFGAGILWQRGGDTTYRAYEMAQGFGGTSGFGLLLDDSGNDFYLAGGKEPCGWLAGQYFSLSQGFGYGMRPFAGGGIGVLADLKGSDRYVADVYGQGSSYWYSVGLLLDAEGNDFYQAFQYSQGAGIHLSGGALIDWSGDDQYSAGSISQGAAHDYGVGILDDRAGNDHYIVDGNGQGTAINNSVALLLDRSGDDFYAGRDPLYSQAAGNDGATREYGSISLLLDLAGHDVYSQGQSNNAVHLKPLHGATVDLEWTNSITSASALDWSRLSDNLPPAPLSARQVYGAVDPSEPMESMLRRAMRSGGSEEHRKEGEAANAELKRLGPDALPYLLNRLDSADVLVRVKIESLIDQIGSNAVPALIAGIAAAKNEEVARLCVYFLARFGDQIVGTNSISPTAGLPGSPPKPLYYDAVVKSILPFLEKPKTRAGALYTLGHWRAREAFDPALAGLDDDREGVRLRAAQALGRLGDSRAVAKLTAALGDRWWMVRYAAEDALVNAGKENIQDLERAYPQAGDRARPYLIEALARLGDQNALSWAANDTAENDPAIRAAIEQGLRANLEKGSK